jgi:hypothetical protein
MAKQRYYLDTRVLTAFFFAAMPFVAFGSFVVVNTARTQLRDSAGVSLEQRAVQTKLALEQYLADQVVHLRLLALEPQVLQALASPAKPVLADESRRIEQAWLSGQDARLVAQIVESPVAARLKSMAQIRPVMKAIQVVDTQGRVLAASVRGGRLFQGESAWFKDIAAQEGEPQAWLGDIQRPPNSTLPLLDIAYPVRSSQGAWIGAVRGLLDANDLYTVLAPVRVGRTGHAILVRSTDGMILASDESERILKMIVPGWESLQSALEGFPLGESGQAIFGKARLRRGYWTIPEVKGKTPDGKEIAIEPTRLVGFSPIDQMPGVKWLVVVQQDTAEALAPIDNVTRYLWIHFIGVFTTVILLALYFSFKLEKPVMEEDLHLHEVHLPAGMKKADED